MDQYIQIQSTVSTIAEAQEIIEILFEKELIACASILPSVESYYLDEGELVSEQEVKIFIKTVADLYVSIEKLIKKYHSYDIPEILVFSVEDGNEEYLRWISKQVKK
jgi:periplasmic divalent cation tolerance protein